MTWLTRIPLWVKVAVPSVVVAVILCNLIGRPDNPPNPAADSLGATRKAYHADTLRLLATLDSLKAEEARERAAKEAEIAKLAAAEHRIAAARVTVAAARAVLHAVDAGRDSGAMVRARDVVIATQDTMIASLDSALDASRAAFVRLTAENALTIRRADSAEAGWGRTRQRLGLAEAALAIEQKRTGCQINLVVTTVGCPSRGVMLAVGVVGGALAYSQFHKNK